MALLVIVCKVRFAIFTIQVCVQIESAAANAAEAAYDRVADEEATATAGVEGPGKPWSASSAAVLDQRIYFIPVMV